MIFKKSRTYLLKKIENKELTYKEVAEELGISEDIVEKEYKDYINPFSDKKAERRNVIIQIGISLFSAIFVAFTLLEMQAERNMAYRPDVYFSFDLPAGGIQNTWNDAGELIESNVNTFSVPIKLQNIGVGTAKNIDFDWKWDENLEKYKMMINRGRYSWVSYIKQQVTIGNKHPEIEDEEERENTCKKDSPDVFGKYRNGDTHVDYLMNAGESQQKIWLPDVYHELVQEAILAQKTLPIQALLLNISYYDIQGNRFQKTYQLTPNVLMWSENGDNMSCLYNYDVKEVKTMGLWEFLSKFSDLATAITAILALLISVAALRDSHKFSKLQREHNVKSVKPIADVHAINYDDVIEITLLNKGIGPMLIKKISFKKDESISESLDELLEYSVGSCGALVFNDSVVEINGEITIMKRSVDPSNQKDVDSADKLRKELSAVTILLQYEDVYGNKYDTQQELTIFKS